ncbi:MAG: sulfite exporter TauE/SafE family protein [Alphaproteobacteria bacterium]
MTLADLMVTDWTTFAFASLVVALAALVQGSIGVGFGIVAAPILAVIDPVMVPGPLLVLALGLAVLLAIRERSQIRYGDLASALAGRIPASFLAGLVVGLLPPEQFLVIFALMILAGVGLSLSGWRVEASKRNLFIAGTASGFMGTITSVGAPPMAIVYQNVAGPQMRATIAAYFTVGAAMSIAALAAFGAFDWHDLALSVKLIPAMAIGFAVSGLAARLVDKGYVRTGVLAICTLSAGLLLVKALW